MGENMKETRDKVHNIIKIYKNMTEINLLTELKVFTQCLDIGEISELEFPCKQLLEPFFKDFDEFTSKDAYLKLQAVLDYMNEKINIGDWKNVRLYVRKTITLATYFKLIAYASSKVSSDSGFHKDAFSIIDHGLLFGCPLDATPHLLQSCATIIKESYNSLDDCGQSSHKTVDIQPNSDSNDSTLEVLDCPSMEYFYTNYITKDKPAILRNVISHWPALSKWQDINYFIKVGGLRTVPVELGSKYTDSEWTQKLMTIEDFINEYIIQNNETKGYLAQYQLFQQIPELKDDIVEPEYCSFTDTDEATDINAWFGPKGTVSPLHYDPKKNLLAQVVGQKRIILFAPSDSDYVYPHEDEMLSNTARVDPRRPDVHTYPLFARAQPLRCVLRAGEMLYIPPKWWHYVESLSVSFSVSFWWN